MAKPALRHLPAATPRAGGVEIVTIAGKRYAVVPLEDYERLTHDVATHLRQLRRMVAQLDRSAHPLKKGRAGKD